MTDKEYKKLIRRELHAWNKDLVKLNVFTYKAYYRWSEVPYSRDLTTCISLIPVLRYTGLGELNFYSPMFREGGAEIFIGSINKSVTPIYVNS